MASGLSSAWNGVTNAANSFVGWVEDNAVAIGAGLMVAGGVALMFTGVGSVAGIAMMAGAGAAMSGGASMALQKAQTGEVNRGQVGTDALIGAVASGGAGAAGRGLTQAARALRPSAVLNPNASALTQNTYAVLRNSTVCSAIAGGTSNGVSNTASYHFSVDARDRTAGGYAQNFFVGMGTGAMGSYGGSRLTSISGRASSNVVEHFVVHEASDRFMGGAAGILNENLRESNTAPDSYRAFSQGFSSGGTGPSHGLLAR